MKRLVIVSDEKHTIETIEKTIKGRFDFITFNGIQEIFGYIYDSFPDLVIVDISNNDKVIIETINHIKADPIFRSLPFLLVVPDNKNVFSVDDIFIDDYLMARDIERDLITRAELSLLRTQRVVEINPLTRLPGNIAIDREIQMRLERKEVFALAYLDIDQFKPFNDKYGFGRGDEVIKVTGRLIINIVKNRQPEESFAGHIGGDDFLFIMDTHLIEIASNDIIEAFDRIIPTFYDQQDREKGVIESKDRKGHILSFPIMTLSIGIAHNKFLKFSHPGEIKETASRMKSYAKKFKGSCFKIDERQQIKP